MTLKTLDPAPPLTLDLRPVIDMTDEQFFRFCQANPELRIERTAEGEITVMPPADAETGNQNADLTMQVQYWAKQDGTGVAFDSSAGFRLPNGATRSPDASWVRRERLAPLTDEQKKKFLPLCPDFAVELRSPSDRLIDVQAKLEEYIANGAQLGWLLDPSSRTVYVYRPGEAVQEVVNPTTVSTDPVLPGFTLDLTDIWEPDL